MNYIHIRLWSTVLIVICTSSAAVLVRNVFAAPVVVRAPTQDIRNLPLELGDWNGVDQPVDPEIAAVLKADVQVDRLYTNGLGSTAVLHAAVWTKQVDSGAIAPHHPSICYPNAGWSVLEQQVLEVEFDGKSVPVCFLQLERGNQRAVTAHWFQMGSHRFTGDSEVRGVLRNFRGQSEWPPVVKVMLHLPVTTIAEAVPNVQILGSYVHDFTKAL